MKNIFSRYANDVIANCAFGIKCDSLNEKNNEFYAMGLTVTTPSGVNAVRGVAAAFLPKVFEVRYFVFNGPIEGIIKLS